ncbi:MAG: ABC transporter ATP-binding protein [Clostridia bacterium]|nr:ABC transporter ATP-binding protein [Clostridia bacterium]
MIEIKNLSQIYPSGKGIFNLNFTVEKGEVFGYLGPNGAGKTTTIRNILGFSNATEGQVTIQNQDAREHAAALQKIIGYLPGEIAFFDNMTGIEFLTFVGQMRNLKDLQKRDALIERFQLDASGKIKKMSKGMKQKVAIVAAFMHDPEVLILDEPTSGLDPLMQNIFLDLILEEKKAGKTIIMSSHIFDEVQKVCDRAGIIKEGQLVAIEAVNELKAMKTETFILTTSDPEDFKRISESGLKVQKKYNKLYVEKTLDYPKFFEILSKCHVTSIETKQQSLEEIFMKYYGEVK